MVNNILLIKFSIKFSTKTFQKDDKVLQRSFFYVQAGVEKVQIDRRKVIAVPVPGSGLKLFLTGPGIEVFWSEVRNQNIFFDRDWNQDPNQNRDQNCILTRTEMGIGLKSSDRSWHGTEKLVPLKSRFQASAKGIYQSGSIEVPKQKESCEGKRSDRILQHSRSVAYRKP
jgi:hypothetical protein